MSPNFCTPLKAIIKKIFEIKDFHQLKPSAIFAQLSFHPFHSSKYNPAFSLEVSTSSTSALPVPVKSPVFPQADFEKDFLL